MITDRKKLADRVIIVAVITMFLSGCRSSPVSPSLGTDMNFSYHIQYRSHVSLRVDNSFHTTILTLVDSTEDAGTYRLSWNTTGYPSGVYFYIFSAIPEGGGEALSGTKMFVVGE